VVVWDGLYPKTSTTTLFSAGAEVHAGVKLDLDSLEPKIRGQDKGISLPGWKVYAQILTFGRSFHAYPGNEPGFSVRNQLRLNSRRA